MCIWDIFVSVVQNAHIALRTFHQWKAATKWWTVNWAGPLLDKDVDPCTETLICWSSVMHWNSRQLEECFNHTPAASFHFLHATACSAKRVLAIVIMSVCLSVTTGYRFKLRWDRDSRFLPYDSLESLVSCEQISCRWARRFLSNEDIKKGYS